MRERKGGNREKRKREKEKDIKSLGSPLQSPFLDSLDSVVKEVWIQSDLFSHSLHSRRKFAFSLPCVCCWAHLTLSFQDGRLWERTFTLKILWRYRNTSHISSLSSNWTYFCYQRMLCTNSFPYNTTDFSPCVQPIAHYGTQKFLPSHVSLCGKKKSFINDEL